MYYIIGDSHVSNLRETGKIEVYHIGHGSVWSILNPEKPQNKELLQCMAQIGKQKVYFLLGEIDCRVFIFNVHKRDGLPLEAVIAATIAKYEQLIVWVKERTEMGIISIPPTGIRESNNIVSGEKEITKFYPDRTTRAEIIRIFNQQLEQLARKHALSFINITPYLDDGNGMMKKELMVDDTHAKAKTIPLFKLLSETP